MNKKLSFYPIKTSFIVLFVVFSSVIFAQIPEKPNPPRLVNDYAAIFTPQQVADLEQYLVMIDDSTSNQITVVTLTDLGGYDKAYVAQQIGQTWGVGGKEYNNGIVILIKPKTDREKGEVFIATGYGLEGAIPDAICNRIIDQQMIPYFKQNDYYSGTVAAVNYLYSLAKGEIDIDREKSNGGLVKLILFIIFIIVLIVFMSKKSNNHDDNSNGHTTYGGGILPWILLGSLGSSGGSGSSGGFSGGSFGGFGGGGFGGGGAGGSW
ncbi:MAG: TPM domain-containing protein [Paludibacteraceae bacterium]|nr:TPM domain-containing protein [Paludibacteraceae bacterium]MBN2786797.1 TPM domain-containing protein [Paludibacteraceae bacterium]